MTENAHSKTQFDLCGRVIGGGSRVFVIAEIGNNHQGSVEIAKQMVIAAKNCGADAVKFQKRSNKNLYTKEYFERPYHSENSFGSTYGMHREALELSEESFVEVQSLATELDVVFFATAFDFESAEFLNEIKVPAFKVASGDLNNVPLIQRIASYGKPLFLSTGGGSLEDVDRTMNVVLQAEIPICLMQCTAGYPPDWSELNLNVVQSFSARYPQSVVGFSSHDNGIAMPVAAAALGAKVIEKHFTLNRTMKGTDHAFSLEPQGLTKLVRDLKRLHVALGDGVKRPFESEIEPIIKMGKKLVASQNLRKGHTISARDIEIKSPGDGIKPYRFEELIGRILVQDLNTGEAFLDSHLSQS